VIREPECNTIGQVCWDMVSPGFKWLVMHTDTYSTLMGIQYIPPIGRLWLSLCWYDLFHFADFFELPRSL